ncbi:MAG: zinc D-Ala-D-Ala carboxypeptidase [Actinomycetota bacterium]|nr:zinc D-Ala-D-Ala carboxypeptidase [Actinomycetota bacterium]
MAAILVAILAATAAPASANVPAPPAKVIVKTALPRAKAKPAAAPAAASVKPAPPVGDPLALTPEQLKAQIKAANALRAGLMRSSAEVAATSSKLERLSAQANTLLAAVSVARIAKVDADSEAAAQKVRLVGLGVQVQQANDGLGQLASDSYVRGGGPLGEMASILEALTAPSPDQSADTLATVQYLVSSRARLFSRLKSLRSAQVAATARATAASNRATSAATSAAKAKSALDAVISEQRAALEGFRLAQTRQIGKASGVRGALLRSEDAAAKAADKELASALHGQDFMLLQDQSSSCGKDSATYPNGRLPASALCPLYAAPGESLTHSAADAFNAMSNVYQRQSGSALCVTDAYRSYAEQVAVKLERPGFAASPGRSQHGLGLAVDLCGGVQSFASPAHLWMQRNAPLYGWFHPAWAEPSGALPEPWHWEFAG